MAVQFPVAEKLRVQFPSYFPAAYLQASHQALAISQGRVQRPSVSSFQDFLVGVQGDLLGLGWELNIDATG